MRKTRVSEVTQTVTVAMRRPTLRAIRLLMLLTPLVTQASQYGKQYLRDHAQWIATIKASINGKQKVIVLDVGANDGWWGYNYARIIRNGTFDVSLVYFEPLPQFHVSLRALVKAFGANSQLVAAAAWTESATLTLHIPDSGKATKSASLTNVNAYSGGAWTNVKNVTVQAVDFSQYLHDAAMKYDIVVLKIDVEGAEYRLLPRLIATGSLCLVDYMLVEWHLKYEPDENGARLSALALRYAFEGLVRRGCFASGGSRGGGPRAFIHDEAYNNGYKGGPVHVEGLGSILPRHLTRDELHMVADKLEHTKSNTAHRTLGGSRLTNRRTVTALHR